MWSYISVCILYLYNFAVTMLHLKIKNAATKFGWSTTESEIIWFGFLDCMTKDFKGQLHMWSRSPRSWLTVKGKYLWFLISPITQHTQHTTHSLSMQSTVMCQHHARNESSSHKWQSLQAQIILVVALQKAAPTLQHPSLLLSVGRWSDCQHGEVDFAPEDYIEDEGISVVRWLDASGKAAAAAGAE